MKNSTISMFLAFILILSPIVASKATTNDDLAIVTIGTGKTQGIYYQAGLMLCQIVNRANQDVLCRVKSTAGSVSNLLAIKQGDIQLGIAQNDTLNAKDKEIATILTLHAESMTVIVKGNSDFNSLEDIHGKKVYLGEPGSGTERTASQILRHCRIDVKRKKTNPQQIVEKMQKGDLDAFFSFVGHPAKNIAAIATKINIRIIPLTGECIDQLVNASKHLVASVIPGNLYSEIPDSTLTVGTNASLVASSKLPGNIAALFSKVSFENIDEIKEFHEAFSVFTKNSMTSGMVAGLHPGIKYFLKKNAIPQTKKSFSQKPKGIMNTIQDENNRIDDLLRYWESALNTGKKTDHLWEMVRSQLHVSRQWILKECSWEICQDFSIQLADLLVRGDMTPEIVRVNMRLLFGELSSSITKKELLVKEQIQKDENEWQQRMMLMTISLLAVVILAFILVAASFFRRGKLVKELEHSNELLKRSEERERVFQELYKITNSLLELMWQPDTSMEQIASQVLKILLKIPFVSSKRGCVLFVGKDGKLVMKVQKGMPPECSEQCTQVTPDQCPCSQAARKKDVLFIPPGMDSGAKIACTIETSGQFFVPFFMREERRGSEAIQGMVVLYQESKGDQEEQEVFLYAAISITLSSVIRRIVEAERNKILAWKDTLTSLENRNAFFDLLVRTIALSSRSGSWILLLFIDVNLFKYVNDTFGHEAGDRLLQEIARRLKKCTRESDTVARIGGDEFTIIMPIDNPDNIGSTAEVIMRKFAKELSSPLVINGDKIFISLSIGIGVCPKDASDANNLMKCADTAMYHAKAEWKTNGSEAQESVTWKLFSEEMQQELRDRKRMIEMLDNAALSIVVPEQQSWFRMFYQILLRSDGTLYGAEVLIRLFVPGKGMLPPDKWISIAEEKHIAKIGRWIIMDIFAQIKFWKESEFNCGKISINISGAQFTLDKDLVQWIIEQLLSHGLTRKDVQFEFTESFKPTGKIKEQIRKLAGYVSIKYDDYGTCGAVLSDLRGTPVDGVKVDRSFIGLLPSKDTKFVQAIFALAKSLDLDLTAEGVEKLEQVEFLQGKVDVLQGFYFSRPLPVSEYVALVKDLERWIGSGKNPMDFWIKKHEMEKNKNS